MTNDDLTKRVVVATDAMAWSAGAVAGVDQKLLEEAGPRRTAIVRMAPGAELPGSGGGTWDVLVLDGTLRDARHHYPAGTYLHTTLRLYAHDTCTVFAKQRPSRARTGHRAVATGAVVFEPGWTPGLWHAPLHEDPDGKVGLLRFDPGTQVPSHVHDDGEEFFVLAGEVRDEHGRYGVGDWVRQPAGSAHAVASDRGCVFFTIAHHLRR